MKQGNTKDRRLSIAAMISAGMIAFATFVVATPAQAADNCGAQFTDSNAPNDASCIFACQGTNQLTIGVDASDTDATASGSARCGGGYSPCRSSAGTNSCYGEEGFANSASASGTCAAVVSEAWNDAWSYNCAAKKANTPDPCPSPPCTEPPPPGNCVFGIICCPPSICAAIFGLGRVSPPQQQLKVCGAATTEAACTTARDAYWKTYPYLGPVYDAVSPYVRLDGADPVSGLPAGVTSRVDVWVVDGTATGRICNVGVGCWSILPACTFDDATGRAACVVSGAPKVLGPAARYEA